MKKSFRDFVQALDDAGELLRVGKSVDTRRLSALMSQSDKAVMFENIADYPDWRVAGALITSRARLAIALDCGAGEIAARFEERAARPIDPEIIDHGPCQDVVLEGDDVDLSAIPYPIMHLFDGGPYISGTFVVSKDPEYGRNCGSYRLMYRTPRETGIDLVSPSDMRFYYQRALDQGKPLEIAVAVGVHP